MKVINTSVECVAKATQASLDVTSTKNVTPWENVTSVRNAEKTFSLKGSSMSITGNTPEMICGIVRRTTHVTKGIPRRGQETCITSRIQTR